MIKDKEKKDSVFIRETKRDIGTFRRLHGKKRLKFIWDYFRWKILAAVTILLIIITFANLLWQGQKPCRLHVCVVLNNDMRCDDWFESFFKKLSGDGKKGEFDLNQDQPFDYKNAYYYVQEIEVQSTISSGRMDVAVCGPDMYDYLLALKACAPLEALLDDRFVGELKEKNMLVESTAGLKRDSDGSLNEEDTTEDYYAIDLSDTEFGHRYNDSQETGEGQDKAALYAVIITDTGHAEDSIKLLEALSGYQDAS